MLNSIRIVNWKGHDELSLNLKKGVNFITGPNGIGKTSILDAICFSLLGTIEFVGSYRGITYKNLIRNPNIDTEINLSLSVENGDQYEIFRRLGSTRSAELKKNGRIIATRWQEVSDKVLELYNVSEFFFSRCIFLSEGDTYEYINRPPGDALAAHIERISGIDRMENLAKVFTNLKRKYHNEADNLRKEVASVSVASERDKERLQSVLQELESLTQKRDTLLNEISEINKRQNALMSELSTTRKSLANILDIMKEWQEHFVPLDEKQDLVETVTEARQQIDRESVNISSEKKQISGEIGRATALIDSQKKILEIVQPLSEEPSIEVVCPVCKRPLTTSMTEDIKKESSDLMESLSLELTDLKVKADSSDKNGRLNLEKSTILNKLESNIRILIEGGLSTLSIESINKRIQMLENQVESINAELDKLNESIRQMDKPLTDTRIEQENLRKKTDPEKIDSVKQSLLSSTKIDLLSEVFNNALSDSLAEQRRIMLNPLTEELSKMWSRFLGRSVNVEMGNKFELRIIDKKYEKPFEFPQLSGGEKTALLILTQIVLCKYFSDSDFMLIDEPLEHLDSRNRWALINFLVQSCKKGFPEQLVVTTIEESFLREYLSDPSVQVISLG